MFLKGKIYDTIKVITVTGVNNQMEFIPKEDSISLSVTTVYVLFPVSYIQKRNGMSL